MLSCRRCSGQLLAQPPDELRCLQCGESHWVRLLLMADRLGDAVALRWALDAGMTVTGYQQVRRRLRGIHLRRRPRAAIA